MNRNADISKSTKELVFLFYNFETNDIYLPPYHISTCFRTLADLTLPGLGEGGGVLVGPRLTFVVYIPRTKDVEALRLTDFS